MRILNEFSWHSMFAQAPECLRLEPYNLKVDVYSYAIVLHQMLSGETPYGFVTSRKMLYYHVVEERGRPRIVDSWDDRIKGMLESSFDADMKLRPVSSSAP